eukprot:gene4069-biopygen12548
MPGGLPLPAHARRARGVARRRGEVGAPGARPEPRQHPLPLPHHPPRPLVHHLLRLRRLVGGGRPRGAPPPLREGVRPPVRRGRDAGLPPRQRAAREGAPRLRLERRRARVAPAARREPPPVEAGPRVEQHLPRERLEHAAEVVHRPAAEDAVHHDALRGGGGRGARARGVAARRADARRRGAEQAQRRDGGEEEAGREALRARDGRGVGRPVLPPAPAVDPRVRPARRGDDVLREGREVVRRRDGEEEEVLPPRRRDQPPQPRVLHRPQPRRPDAGAAALELPPLRLLPAAAVVVVS